MTNPFEEFGLTPPPNLIPGDPDAVAWAEDAGAKLQAQSDIELDKILDALRMDMLNGVYTDGSLFALMVLDFVKRKKPMTDYSILAAALIRLARYESEVDRIKK